MTADLPDIPEAAVEAGAEALDAEPWFATTEMVRTVLKAALPKLIEQGWAPPGEDARP